MDVLHRIFGRGEHTSDASPTERLADLKRKYAPMLFRLEQECLDLETEIEGEAMIVRGTVPAQRVADDLRRMAQQIDENGLDLELHIEVDDRRWPFAHGGRR